MLSAPHWPSPSTSGSPSLASSPRSHMSILSVSSSLSSFSDVSSLASVPSPSASPAPFPSKTHAFFGASFSDHSSSLVPPPPLLKEKRSRTADFFATPSPTSIPVPATTKTLPPLSRFFPSRYGSHHKHDSSISHHRVLEDLSTTWATSPTTDVHPVQVPDSDSSHEATPRPKDLEPNSFPIITVEPIGPQSVIASDSNGLSLRLVRSLGQGAFSSVWLAEDESIIPLAASYRATSSSRAVSRSSSLRSNRSAHRGDRNDGRLVAVKMTPRTSGERDRTRVSFVREVEVLRHISHPNITALLSHFTTPTHHVLVLPYVSGGDLLSLVNSDEMHSSLTESILQRIWCELCKAVGWMHSVGLVHRDIKLENILLTATLPRSHLPTPLVKLTDFGLSRFIDEQAPLLTTRCGSEAYAAPELVIGGRGYDGRETDAWACGVVLYALMGRMLPFGEGVGAPAHEGGKIVGERERGSPSERRHFLMSIAKGEFEWPTPPETTGTVDGCEELAGQRLLECKGARRIASKLLVRDPTKRAKIADLWEDEWMQGVVGVKPGYLAVSVPASPSGLTFGSASTFSSASSVASSSGSIHAPPEYIESEQDTEEAKEILDDESARSGYPSSIEDGLDDYDSENEDGWLVDREGIDGIACREVQ